MKTIKLTNQIDGAFSDISQSIHNLQRENKRNLTKDEIDAGLKTGFDGLEGLIKESDSLSGQLIRIQKSVPIDTLLSIIIVTGIAVIIVFIASLI